MYDYTAIKYLYSREKEILFKTIENDTSKYHIRNKAIFCLAEYAGLRASEVGLIHFSDINLESREVYFHRLKNSNNNTLRIIDNDVYTSLIDYMQERKSQNNDSQVLFLSQKGNPISRKVLDNLMKKYCAAAGIPKEKAHFHTLKHTRAVELAELGLDTKEIQYWIGHKSIKNTEIYFQFTSKQQETLYKKILFLQNSSTMI